MRHEYQRPTPVEEDVRREESVVMDPLSFAQVITFAIGVANVVFGAVALARLGLSDLTAETTEVAGLGMTGVLAVSHLVIGLLALMGAASRVIAISTMAIVGPVLIVGGIIALIERISWLGWNESNGVAYIIMGAVALASAALTRDVAIVEQRFVRLQR